MPSRTAALWIGTLPGAGATGSFGGETGVSGMLLGLEDIQRAQAGSAAGYASRR